ncbi:MAG: spore germination protein GerW family protein [Negativicutes bacterium]|nr:spore germination protein GerW family protein [Negativicutes bacterium]
MAGVNVTDSIGVLFEHLEKMLSAKTIFGEPIIIGDVTLIPVVDIAFGAGAGGGACQEKRGDGAGGGAGARVTASAVIVVRDSQVQVMKLKHAAALDRILELVPDLVQSLKKDKAEAKDEAAE